ncbi:MAG: valine--tRNA ligase, partial [Omnitrophica WOR_2 bacterium]
KISQWSFIDLYRKGLAYRREAPTIWCSECRTAIAQAELNDLDSQSEFVTLPFLLPGGDILPIATTRPELLPACVAVFIHPDDPRYRDFTGQKASVPLFGQQVPVLQDKDVDPGKGTGAVMCCTFGDTTDVAWWHTYQLPLIEAIDRQGRMKAAAGELAGLTIPEARRQVKHVLEQKGLILERRPVSHSIRVHERCDTPAEYIVTNQWFIRVLDNRQQFLEAGNRINWRPEQMRSRYQAWVENLNWDWCISRQRYFGVPFPVWYCRECGEIVLADEDQLPVDPAVQQPAHPCTCGSTDFIPDEDFFDTWQTSSMTPQIVGRWTRDMDLYHQVFPYSLRPQAHEIIRTWAFDTIVKSLYHFETLPWKDVLISGWGVAGEGMGKISKSRGGGPMPPMEMIQRYGADAVRYWAASSSPGKDSVISEEKIQNGARLVTKLWNVARFSERFLQDYHIPASLPDLSPADRWILSRLQKLVARATGFMEGYDYAAAKSEIENFFWRELADNYLEMCKQRLYTPDSPQYAGANYALHQAFLAILKLFAPFFPYVTEEIYQGLFLNGESRSIHRSKWPVVNPALEDDWAEGFGELLVGIATAVRRHKSEHNLSLGTEFNALQIKAATPELEQVVQAARDDLISVTRAKNIEMIDFIDGGEAIQQPAGSLSIRVVPS